MAKFPAVKSGRQDYLDSDLYYQHPINSSVKFEVKHGCGSHHILLTLVDLSNRNWKVLCDA